MINRTIRYSLEHRLLTVFLVILASIIGIFAAVRMPKDIYPDLSPPVVTIVTENEGMAAEDVERLISFPLESLLKMKGASMEPLGIKGFTTRNLFHRVFCGGFKRGCRKGPAGPPRRQRRMASKLRRVAPKATAGGRESYGGWLQGQRRVARVGPPTAPRSNGGRLAKTPRRRGAR